MILLACACRRAPEPLPDVHGSADLEEALGGNFAPGPELVLGLRIVRPEATYGVFRTLASRALPQSPAVLLTAMLGLNPTLSGRFVGGRDWYGVFTVDGDAQFGWALGVPVVSGRELVAEVALGSDARLKAHRRDGWTELTGGAVGPLGALSAGVSGNFLVLGSSATATSALAPWLAHGASLQKLAPAQEHAGVSARLFSAGLGLQAMFAAWRETWLPTLLRLAAGASARSPLLPLADVEQEWNQSISAYLGTIIQGDFYLRWSGEKLLLKGELAAPEAPDAARGSQLCRAAAGLPQGTKWWVGGTDAAGSGRPSSPDWDAEPGDWQRALFRGLSGVAVPLVVGTPPTPVVRQEPGIWLLGWREDARTSTALGVLGSVAPASSGQLTAGRLSSRPQQGKPVEWAWAPKDGGLVTALGAPLGEEWSAWVGPTSGTGWPRGLSPSACERLLAALGNEAGVMLALERSDGGLQVNGALDLSTLSGALQ